MKTNQKIILGGILSVVIAVFFVLSNENNTNQFSASEKNVVYQTSDFNASQYALADFSTKCGEGKCGEANKKGEKTKETKKEKCGEGKCGEASKTGVKKGEKKEKTETKCGEGKCGEGKKSEKKDPKKKNG